MSFKFKLVLILVGLLAFAEHVSSGFNMPETVKKKVYFSHKQVCQQQLESEISVRQCLIRTKTDETFFSISEFELEEQDDDIHSDQNFKSFGSNQGISKSCGYLFSEINQINRLLSFRVCSNTSPLYLAYQVFRI